MKDKSMIKIKLHSYMPIILLTISLFILMLILSLSSQYFLTQKNIANIFNQSAIYIILSIAMTFVICSGGIDLSVGSIMGFSPIVMGLFIQIGMKESYAIILGLLCGVLIGICNGLLISYLKINPFITTLSTMSIIRGMCILITDGKPIFGFDKFFRFWGSGTAGSINPPIAISLFIFILSIILLRKTKFGEYSLVLGSNHDALIRTGVDTNKYKILIYMFSGLCAAISGFIVCARLNTAEPLAGTGYEMDAIAAVVLGGTSMQGGKGSVLGTFIACLVLNIIKNGLTILSISSNYQKILTGLIILIAVAIPEIQKMKNKEME